MAKYTGDLMVIKFGTLTVSGSARTLEIQQSVDEIDVTTYGSTDREFIPGMSDRSASMEVLDDDTSTAVRAALKVGTSNSLTWYPLGTVAGKPMFSVGTAVVLENNISYPYDDAVLMSVNMRLSGAVTEGVAP